MNLILLHPDDLTADGHARVTGRRAGHIREVHRAEKGDELRVGLLGGRMGTGRVEEVSPEAIVMSVRLMDDPPRPLPVTLLLALPRPKAFRRVLQGVTTLGVKRIALFGAYKVEKSYWQSPWLEPEPLREQLILGLEQARDTVLPRVTLHPLFKPFIEDEVPGLAGGTRRLVAHPGGMGVCPTGAGDGVTLAIGPEGGFTEYELGLLFGAGFEPVTLGPRILRTEQAVPALLGRFL